MPKFVTRAVVLGFVWIATQAAAPLDIAPRAAQGADHEFPVFNSIGRFFGVGYTKGGYHAAQDGRLDAISNRHPASDYRPGGLPLYTQPMYSPPRSLVGTGPTPQLAPVTTDATPPKSGPSAASPSNASPKSNPTAPQADVPPKSAAPVKPAEPPPAWLEEYLQQSEADKRREIPLHELPQPKEPRPQDRIPEGSPSDLLLDEPSAELGAGHELDFSIIESGFPAPVYQSQMPSNATRPMNRYR